MHTACSVTHSAHAGHRNCAVGQARCNVYSRNGRFCNHILIVPELEPQLEQYSAKITVTAAHIP